MKVLSSISVVTIAVVVSLLGFSQLSKAIQITQISPNSGSTTGGETVTINGDFRPAAPITMQAMTDGYCASLPVYDGNNSAAVITLNDPRGDGQQYQVAKLADGNCWMLNNLKLGSTTGTTSLTPTDTNIKTDRTLPQVDTSASVYFDSPRIYSSAPGNSNDITSNTFYGYYYNWCVAGAADPSACTSSVIQPADITEDICPAGWHLPSSGDMKKLDVAFGGTGASSNVGPSQSSWSFGGAFKGVFAGYYDTMHQSYGTLAQYLTSEPNPANSDSVWLAILDNTSIFLDYMDFREYGRTIRCVHQQVSNEAPNVTLDGVPAVVTAWDNGSVTVTTPPHAAGRVDVVVTRGSESFTLANGYEYVDPNAAPPVTPTLPVVPSAPNTGRG